MICTDRSMETNIIETFGTFRARDDDAELVQLEISRDAGSRAVCVVCRRFAAGGRTAIEYVASS